MNVADSILKNLSNTRLTADITLVTHVPIQIVFGSLSRFAKPAERLRTEKVLTKESEKMATAKKKSPRISSETKIDQWFDLRESQRKVEMRKNSIALIDMGDMIDQPVRVMAVITRNELIAKRYPRRKKVKK